MYYIQRFRKAEETPPAEGMNRIITSEHMGSVEFEMGRASRCIRWLRLQPLQVSPVKKLDGRVTFYVIGTQASLDRFNKHIDFHLSSDKIGRRSKEPTGLYERFVSKTPFSNLYEETKVWLDIGCAMDGSAIGLYPDDVPVLFTADRFLALRMYLELYRTQVSSEKFELNLFDKVYFYKSKQLQTVAGLNEDETVTLKAYGKRTRTNWFDVWPEALFPLDRLKFFGVF